MRRKGEDGPLGPRESRDAERGPARGLALGPVGSGRREYNSDAVDIYAELSLRHDANVQSFVRITVASIRLSNVSVSGKLDALDLQGLDLAFDARGLRLGPTEARDVKVDSVRLVHHP